MAQLLPVGLSGRHHWGEALAAQERRQGLHPVLGRDERRDDVLVARRFTREPEPADDLVLDGPPRRVARGDLGIGSLLDGGDRVTERERRIG
jgi:hypothetical protein